MKKLFLHALLVACMLAFLPLAHAVPFSSKFSFLGGGQDDILPPDQAFQLHITPSGTQSLQATFTVAPGHYLYRDRIKFETAPQNWVNNVQLPRGESKQDPTFGVTEVYHQDFQVPIALTLPSPQPQTVTLLATYQGCSEKGLCYSPIHKTIQVRLPATGSTNGQSATASASPAVTDEAGALLQSRKLWLIAAGFFGFGLLLAFTPCMLPMIPILSGIIAGGKQGSRWQHFNLSLTYVLGMAFSYTAAGIAAGLSGRLLSNALQNAWVLGATALLFVLLALSMFGFYEIRLPGAAETGLSNLSRRFKGGRFLGVFLMGVISALIVSPCVAAPLAGALVYIGQTRDIILGGSALLAMSLGMGLPLLVIGTSAGSLLPKAGPWMDRVRQFFGVLMLAVALWVASPLLPPGVYLALWAALLIVPAVFLHALDRLPPESGAWPRFWKGIAVIMLLAGACLLVGAFSGATSPLRPLAAFTQGQTTQASPLPFKRIRNTAELDRELQLAGNQPVMLDFYADWCVACKEMEAFTFSDAKVRTLLGQMVLLQADVTANSAEDLALQQRFGLFGPPAMIFFKGTGPAQTVVGFKNADEFRTILQSLL